MRDGPILVGFLIMKRQSLRACLCCFCCWIVADASFEMYGDGDQAGNPDNFMSIPFITRSLSMSDRQLAEFASYSFFYSARVTNALIGDAAFMHDLRNFFSSEEWGMRFIQQANAQGVVSYHPGRAGYRLLGQLTDRIREVSRNLTRVPLDGNENLQDLAWAYTPQRVALKICEAKAQNANQAMLDVKAWFERRED